MQVQLCVGNFCFGVPKPNAVFFNGKTRNQNGFFKVIGLKKQRSEIPSPPQVVFL